MNAGQSRANQYPVQKAHIRCYKQPPIQRPPALLPVQYNSLQCQEWNKADPEAVACVCCVFDRASGSVGREDSYLKHQTIQLGQIISKQKRKLDQILEQTLQITKSIQILLVHWTWWQNIVVSEKKTKQKKYRHSINASRRPGCIHSVIKEA